MTSPQPTLNYPEIDYCTLSFSILGIIGTICATLQLTLACIRKTCLCIPENTWYLHFLLLMGILSLFVSSCIPEIFVNNYIVFCFTQLSPAICVYCILTLATNLLFVYIYQQYFSPTFLLILPVLLAFPILILLILFYIYSYRTAAQCTHTYPQGDAERYVDYNYIQLAMTSIYLYLDYFLTISMILTLCLYKTFYGKLLCLTTWTSWILWNINWSIFCSCIHLFITLYFYPAFGYILLLYIYSILLSKYFKTLPLVINQLTLWCSSPPPRYNHRRLKNKHEYPRPVIY
nr:G protein-coupled receptor 8B [Elephant endotheliotropic herpesvirus 1A]